MEKSKPSPQVLISVPPATAHWSVGLLGNEGALFLAASYTEGGRDVRVELMVPPLQAARILKLYQDRRRLAVWLLSQLEHPKNKTIEQAELNP